MAMVIVNLSIIVHETPLLSQRRYIFIEVFFPASCFNRNHIVPIGVGTCETNILRDSTTLTEIIESSEDLFFFIQVSISKEERIQTLSVRSAFRGHVVYSAVEP